MPHIERREVARTLLNRLDSPQRQIINDDLELAAELGCGLHLPERSSLVAEARERLGPSALIGRSVHSPESAVASHDVDYLIAGHVFATSSKPGLPPLGLDGLTAIVASSPAPVLAIGGITADHIPAVIAAGAHGVAVISAIADSADPRAAAARLSHQLARSLKELPPMSTAETIASPIAITVNGKSLSMPAGSSVADLLVRRQLDQRLVAVERNRTIVPPAQFPSTLLAAGDEIEIVHFVGGG